MPEGEWYSMWCVWLIYLCMYVSLRKYSFTRSVCDNVCPRYMSHKMGTGLIDCDWICKHPLLWWLFEFFAIRKFYRSAKIYRSKTWFPSFILAWTLEGRLWFIYSILPVPKCGSIFENFVINILQNEKQYLQNFLIVKTPNDAVRSWSSLVWTSTNF